jgi:hypothetical protein
MWTRIANSNIRAFVHAITSGTTMRYSLDGRQQPWEISLSGTTAIWTPFGECYKNIAPAVVAAWAIPPSNPSRNPFNSPNQFNPSSRSSHFHLTPSRAHSR